jgi:hypothetical protein
MRSLHNRLTKNPPVGVPKDHLVDLKDLRGGPKDHLAGQNVLPVDQAGPLGGPVDLLVGPEVHLASDRPRGDY